MINTTSLIAFSLTAGILLVIPGPTILTVVAYGLRMGRKAVWASTAGVVLGDLTAVIVCLTGLGAILAVSPSIYEAIKWAGVAYLVYIAVQTWRESNAIGGHAAVTPDVSESLPLSKVFQQTFIVTALNPKGIVFFLAFIPQFVDRSLAYWPQVTIYGLVFVSMGGVNALLYAYSSGRLSAFFTHPRAMKWLKRVSAGFLGSAALITALHHAPNP